MVVKTVCCTETCLSLCLFPTPFFFPVSVTSFLPACTAGLTSQTLQMFRIRSAHRSCQTQSNTGSTLSSEAFAPNVGLSQFATGTHDVAGDSWMQREAQQLQPVLDGIHEQFRQSRTPFLTDASTDTGTACPIHGVDATSRCSCTRNIQGSGAPRRPDSVARDRLLKHLRN